MYIYIFIYSFIYLFHCCCPLCSRISQLSNECRLYNNPYSIQCQMTLALFDRRAKLVVCNHFDTYHMKYPCSPTEITCISHSHTMQTHVVHTPSWSPCNTNHVWYTVQQNLNIVHTPTKITCIAQSNKNDVQYTVQHKSNVKHTSTQTKCSTHSNTNHL